MTIDSIFVNSPDAVVLPAEAEFEPFRLQGPLPEGVLDNDPLAMTLGVSARKELVLYEVLNARQGPVEPHDPDCKDASALDDQALWSSWQQFEPVQLDLQPAPQSFWRKSGG